MFRDLFVNTVIFIAFLLIIGHIFRTNPFTAKQDSKTKIVLGLLFGILGSILMAFSIHVTDSVVIDLRHIPNFCAGVLGGPLSAIISAVIIAAFRVLYFGLSTASVTAHIAALAVGFGAAGISRMKISRSRKFFYMFLFSMVASNAALIYLIEDSATLVNALLHYWSINFFGTVLAIFICEYIISVNANFITMNYYKMSADKLLDMITTHKVGGEITYVSESIQRLTGYTQQEFIGASVYNYIHPQDIDEIKQSMKGFDGIEIKHLIYRMRRKSGNYIWVEAIVQAIKNDDGSIKELICVTRDVSLRKSTEEKLQKAKSDAERLAAIDDLTGIFNRRAFSAGFDAEFMKARRERTEMSLIIADIDHFKNVNDRYGHLAGDIVLKEFTQCLVKSCRPNDIIGRHGGEEFAICLPDTNCEQAAIAAEHMRKAVEQMEVHIDNHQAPVRITASFGIASLKLDSMSGTEDLLMQADKAMYKAKSNGRNCVFAACDEWDGL